MIGPFQLGLDDIINTWTRRRLAWISLLKGIGSGSRATTTSIPEPCYSSSPASRAERQ